MTSENKDSNIDDANPFKKTQKVAEQLMIDATHSGDNTAIEITKVAIAIFTDCLYKTMTKHSHNKYLDLQALREDLYKQIGAEVKEAAAKRVLSDLESVLGKDFDLKSCASNSLDPTTNEMEKFDNGVAILHSVMVNSCLEQTNKLLTSNAFVEELSALLFPGG